MNQTKNVVVNGVSIFKGDVKKTQQILEKHSRAIKNAEEKGKQSILNIAGNLQEIASCKAYELEEYKGIGEYASEKFGYSKGTTSDYCKVASIFLKAHNKEHTTFECVLPTVDGIIWNMGQLKELSRLGLDTTIECIENGTISPSNSSKDIRTIVQGIEAKKDGKEEAEETEETEETKKSNQVADTDINKAITEVKENNPDLYKFCEKLLKKIGKIYLAVPEKKRLKAGLPVYDTMNEIKEMIQALCIEKLDTLDLTETEVIEPSCNTPIETKEK